MEERGPLCILCSLPPAFRPVVGSASVCALAESIADLTRVFYYWVLCISLAWQSHPFLEHFVTQVRLQRSKQIHSPSCDFPKTAHRAGGALTQSPKLGALGYLLVDILALEGY